MSKRIFIVIPYYNGREYLPDCFASLAKQTILPDKIIFVENKSTDGSQEDLRKLADLHSNVKVIFQSANTGFVGACNTGIQEAIDGGADSIFLLNQDTVCDEQCLENLLSTAESNTNAFAIQALLLCWPRQDLIQTSGDHIHFLGFGYSGDYKLKIENCPAVATATAGQAGSRPGGDKLKIQQVTYASGAAMFLSVEAIKKVGLFDQDLFMYHEDLDLCWRARLMGYQIILAPQAIVYHKYTEGVVKSRWYWSERNRALTLLKFYKWPTLLLIFVPWLVMELGVLLYSLLTGWFHLKIKSYWSALGLLSVTLQKRNQLQRTRIISDRKIAQWLDGRFNFAGLNSPILKNIVNPIFGAYWWIIKNIIFW